MFPLIIVQDVSFTLSASPGLCVRPTLKAKVDGCQSPYSAKRRSDSIQLLTALEPRPTDWPFLLVNLFRTLVQDVEQNVGERVKDYKVDETS